MKPRHFGTMLLIAGACVLLSRHVCPDAHPRIVLDETSGTIEVQGLRNASAIDASAWPALLHVHASGDESDVPPVAGAYDVTRETVRFRPRFPLVRGLSYQVRFEHAKYLERTGDARVAAPAIETTFILPGARRSPGTVVTAVYPSGDALPENQLKFYVSFSAPMTAGEARKHIHLLDDEGREVPRVFLWLEEELWDRSRRTLTLILDPGRVKRGLRANVEDGAPLHAGRSYRLVIDASLPDGNGTPLRAAFTKAFRVVDADRQTPDPSDWQLSTPSAGTTDPLELRFDEPLDYALLHEMIAIRNAAGTAVPGTMRVREGERVWQFHPAQPWRTSRHFVHVRAEIEDRSGNGVGRLFEVDLREAQGEARDGVELSFEPL